MVWSLFESPDIYFPAVNVKTGDIYRATFLDHGPDMPLRSARHFTGTEEVCKDCCWKMLLAITYNYQPTYICIQCNFYKAIFVHMWNELHMKFTWTSHGINVILVLNPLNMNFIWRFHMKFTWKLNSQKVSYEICHKFYLLTLGENHLKFMWNNFCLYMNH